MPKTIKPAHILVGIIAVFLIAFGINRLAQSTLNQSPATGVNNAEVVNRVTLQFEAEGAKVPLEEIFQGCPGGQDCIPSIDDPTFESTSSADEWLKDSDRVFILERNQITRIYPQKILNWHEIVNDWFADDAIAITFCPLCGSAVAFERVVDGTITEFGVSGKLHNNDLIMYDRLEGSGWQQITGEAIFGPAARRDERLTPILLTISEWQDALQNHLDAKVLTRESAGYALDRYDQYPYGTYEQDGQILFGSKDTDTRLHPKEWVYGISINGTAKAYPEEDIINEESITDSVAGETITLTYQNGEVNITDQDGQAIVPLRLFWFAWASFNPDTLLYQ